MRTSLLVAVPAAMLSIAPAAATVLIGNDAGGKMNDYVARYRQVGRSGEPVVIDGVCLSACTMVLGFVRRDRVCATGNAVLGFHAAWEFDRSGARIASPSGTRDLMRTYPAAVRAWIARHGGLTPTIKFLQGRDLAAIVAPCDQPARAAGVSPGRRGGVRQVRRDGDARRASFDAR